ncbi:lysophospholipid acyltransferase family protein [Campylobacter mucosalis]|uniref:lysophospholipid acyltransferase family protein n=1 Tax=Campylobacter mucosalis TaxID=202 RepID=UPI0014702861|nr:lysophospholipid acyltransferase family protein [Campylobacter mucosalis]
MILSRIKGAFYAVEFILSVVCVVISMWLFPKFIHPIRKIWAKTQRWFGLYKIEVIGNPANDANLIMINHKSMLDIVVMEEIYPKNLAWVAKKEIGDIPVIGKILSIPKMIPIDRSSPRAIVNLLKEAKDRIQSGRVIAIFPEGTRARGDKLLKFQSGTQVIADKLDLKVQPVVIVGSEILDVKKFSFKNGNIKIVFLDPVDRSDGEWLSKTRLKMQETLDYWRER